MAHLKAIFEAIGLTKENIWANASKYSKKKSVAAAGASKGLAANSANPQPSLTAATTAAVATTATAAMIATASHTGSVSKTKTAAAKK